MTDKMYSIFMLALVIWREARGAGLEAMIAVGWSIKNRVDMKSWFGKNYIDVITKKWQYSSISDPGDKQLTLFPQLGDPQFEQCSQIAEWIINNGSLQNPIADATHYYDDSILAPKWVVGAKFIKKIGKLNFYKAK